MKERILYEALVYHALRVVAYSSCHASSRGVSPINWEFRVLLYEKVNHKKWRPVQAPLAWSVCGVVCTETPAPGCSDHTNNQTFVEVSTGRSDRIVT